MNIENGDMKQLLERTDAVLTARDGERIRRGVWRKVRRHRTMVKVRYALATAAVIVIAVIATLRTSPDIGTNGWDVALMTNDELMQEIAQMPSGQVAAEMLEYEGDSIAEALLSDSDISDAVATLSADEQEELLLALSDISLNDDEGYQ